MTLKSGWLWDRKITVDQARGILKDPANSRFLPLAATLLARKNTPKEVFKYYIRPLDFLKYWQRIKRMMRRDDWNNPRIIYWQAMYEVLKEKYEKKGLQPKKEPAALDKEDVFCKAIADKIRLVRKAKGLTQSELAHKLKVSQQAISRIESGRENVSLATLKRIVDALGAQIEMSIN